MTFSMTARCGQSHTLGSAGSSAFLPYLHRAGRETSMHFGADTQNETNSEDILPPLHSFHLQLFYAFQRKSFSENRTAAQISYNFNSFTDLKNVSRPVGPIDLRRIDFASKIVPGKSAPPVSRPFPDGGDGPFGHGILLFSPVSDINGSQQPFPVLIFLAVRKMTTLPFIVLTVRYLQRAGRAGCPSPFAAQNITE